MNERELTGFGFVSSLSSLLDSPVRFHGSMVSGFFSVDDFQNVFAEPEFDPKDLMPRCPNDNEFMDMKFESNRTGDPIYSHDECPKCGYKHKSRHPILEKYR